MKVSIIIPVWNKWELTKACLQSLRETVPAGLAEVIVVDNASSDETAAALPGLFPEVRYARQETNTGFARGNNIGSRLAQGDLIMLLNNDTVTEGGWLEPLVALFDTHPQAGVAGSKLLYPDRRIQHAGVAFSRNRDPIHIYRNAPADFAGVNVRRQYPAVTGACFMMTRARYLEFGGLREDYINGYEDVDLCLQVRQRGLEVWYEPASCVVHFESQTPGRKAREDENRQLFFGRWRELIVPDDERYYREDGFAPALFPYIERMTHVVDAVTYLPTRWEMGAAASDEVRAFVGRLQLESPVPVEVVEQGADGVARGQVRPGFRYLTYPLAVADKPVTEAEGSVCVQSGLASGVDKASGRGVTFPRGLDQTMAVSLLSFNLDCSDPRRICARGLKGLRRGTLEGPVYAREFAALWPSDVNSCRFDTELAVRGGDWDAARQRLDRFFANDRFNTYVTLRLAEILLRCGDAPRARTILDDFLKTKPLFLRARWLRWKAA